MTCRRKKIHKKWMTLVFLIGAINKSGERKGKAREGAKCGRVVRVLVETTSVGILSLVEGVGENAISNEIAEVPLNRVLSLVGPENPTSALVIGLELSLNEAARVGLVCI